jgi:hypothetical protein
LQKRKEKERRESKILTELVLQISYSFKVYQSSTLKVYRWIF